ncbi:unnamed protein product [Rodentolepis nana]|uniref:RING-type domain-containing protein n=1 Tax=Rodentolepis nana TaxID=102285 RepID=A0A0R3U0P8_RODNA|nr:unnamed protein product [Rodentolepis nana]
MSSSNLEESTNGSESKPASASRRADTQSDLQSKLAQKITAVRQDSNTSRDKLENGQNGSSGPEAKIYYTPTPGEKFKCVACSDILRRPVKFEICGHSCCSTCYSDITLSTGRCPVDDNVLERSDVTIDKQMQRDLDYLGVKCNHFEQGCSWTGLAKDLMDHLEECQHRLVACIYDCGVEFEVILSKFVLNEKENAFCAIGYCCQHKRSLYSTAFNINRCREMGYLDSSVKRQT